MEYDSLLNLLLLKFIFAFQKMNALHTYNNLQLFFLKK